MLTLLLSPDSSGLVGPVGGDEISSVHPSKQAHLVIR